MLSSSNGERSYVWYAFPALLAIIGGIIAYYFLRKDDHYKAKNCLWLGIILSVSYVGYYIVFYVMIEMFDSV